jgi:hypothetical protein
VNKDECLIRTWALPARVEGLTMILRCMCNVMHLLSALYHIILATRQAHAFCRIAFYLPSMTSCKRANDPSYWFQTATQPAPLVRWYSGSCCPLVITSASCILEIDKCRHRDVLPFIVKSLCSAWAGSGGFQLTRWKVILRSACLQAAVAPPKIAVKRAESRPTKGDR